MIDESIKDTRAFIKTLTEARYSKRPHVPWLMRGP
jgi:hypothetical protein